MRKSLTHVASMLVGRPLCITPAKLETILAVLGPRLGLAPSAIPVSTSFDFDEDEDDDEDDGIERRGQVAVLNIFGTLVQRASYLDSPSGLVSYEAIKERLSRAMSDPEVKAVVLNIDSPGGDSAQMMDAADYIFSQRGRKPLIAACNDQMCSAAYALGSACDSIFVSRTSMIGSIGCYMVHVDQSARDSQQGLRYTFVAAGAKKTEANVHEPLDPSARATMQNEVDRIRAMFVSLVARNRDLPAKAFMDTEAGIAFGPAACPLFADLLCVDVLDTALSVARSKIPARTISTPSSSRPRPGLPAPSGDSKVAALRRQLALLRLR